MVRALKIRDDLSAEALRRAARRERDGRAAARMYAIANALEGMSRAEAARLAGMERQALRDYEQRVAKDQQLKGQAGDERGKDSNDESAKQEKTLFARLGGDQGVNAIVDDFIARALLEQPQTPSETGSVEQLLAR